MTGALLWVWVLLLAGPSAYLGIALALAARRGRPVPVEGRGLRFIIVVPAHDEELMIAATLASLAGLDYDASDYEVVVVADNCSDRTAAIAREHGATVLERDEPGVVGKPAVLAWTAPRLAAWDSADAVAVVDADCEVTPNLLAALSAPLAAGAGAAQARYVVSNADESWLTALRAGAFMLDNHVKPLARDRLGVSSGLFGTGMAFRAGVIAELPWEAFLLTEDYEYHLQLVEAGERAVYVPEAQVASPMPASFGSSHSQHARWEAGRRQLIRTYVPRMLRRGLRERDLRMTMAAVDRLVPPITILTPATLLALVVGAVAGAGAQTVVAAVLLALQLLWVIGGLALARAPSAVWRALAAAPALVAWKLVLRVEDAVGRRPTHWLRTTRDRRP